jgi:hypothetical protein
MKIRGTNEIKEAPGKIPRGLRELRELRRLQKYGKCTHISPTADCSQEINPVLEIRRGRQANIFQQSPERLPYGHLPGNDNSPMLPVFSDVLIVQIHKVPDIEGHQAAFFVDGKRKLLVVGFPFSFQILGVNGIKSPLPQRVGQARVDIFIQEQF